MSETNASPEPSVFAVPGEDGRLRGFIDLGWAPGMAVPPGAVPVTDEQRAEMLRHPAHWRLSADGTAFEPFEPPVPAVRRIPRAEFLARLTPAERTAMLAAAARDIVAMSAANRLGAMRVVDLDAPATRAALEDLAGAGALAAARVDELLAD